MARFMSFASGILLPATNRFCSDIDEYALASWDDAQSLQRWAASEQVGEAWFADKDPEKRSHMGTSRKNSS
jgi:hypothetical protein